MHAFASPWMRKAKRRGVQGNTRKTAGIWYWSAVQRTVVDMITANRSTGLAQLDVNLMRPAGF